jgi:malonyl-CoA/methylmalonyl-CoA synthetase
VTGTLTALWRDGAPADASVPFLRVPGGQVWSYGDLERQSGRIANGLVAAGVAPGDRVAAQLQKSPGVLALYLGCLRSGAVFLPMNTAYTPAEVDYLLADSSPAVALVGDEGAATLAALAEGQPAEFADVERAPRDLAAILYTSGTTGRPKGAMLTHGNLVSNAVTLASAWGFGGSDVLVHALPTYHAHGLFVAVNCVLASGCSMVFLPRFDPDAVLDALPAATVFMGVPTMYVRLLASPRLDRARCERMRLFVSGSAPLSAATHAEFAARTGQQILERYGMTETVMLTSNPLHGARKPGTVGPPLPGVSVRVVPRAGAGDADGVGGVEVRGPNVFAGYWGKPELTAMEMTADGWFRTGDLGRFDDDGYLELVGRSKDLVISGGLNVYPKEVEAVLDGLDGVVESAVIGVPDADLGEAVVAVVVPVGGAPIDEASLRAAARAELAGFKCPKRFHLVEELPRNTMGKVEKNVLRERFGGP